MLDKKIFFLILAILASYFLFTEQGFTGLMNLVGNVTGSKISPDSPDSSSQSKQTPKQIHDNTQSGGEPLTPQQGLGNLQASVTTDIKNRIASDMANYEGVKMG